MSHPAIARSGADFRPAAPRGVAVVPREDLRLVSAALAWGAAGAITLFWPNLRAAPFTADLAVGQWGIGLLLLCAFGLNVRLGGVWRWLRANGPWLIALPVILSVWQVASAKTGLWPQPYFPPPQGLIEAYATDTRRLAESVGASLVLLGAGVALGALAGFLTGLATGWSPGIAYWTKPVLRLIGPVPTTALIPLVLFLFPSSFSGGVFLVALATWFPVAILTWSGVAGVDKAYYDVARTLGGSERFLLLRVAVPASLPHVFVGLFMGLGHGIAVLVVAEMIGVKAGLGYYVEWARGWTAYGHLYAGLVVMALLFSLLTTLLFRIRDRVLTWQKGVVQW
ncbi:ABC transporter permease [Methylobacterium sp. ID0610]|uniref:ABC transporter permease n=1 Tax=Methylobacterium carpenticola TaxID=3344827 RepID=UPI00368DC15C